MGAGVASVEGPSFPDQASDGDDRVGEIEEGVDVDRSPFVAALELVDAGVPWVGAVQVPALPGLDRRFVACVGDLAVQASGGQFCRGSCRSCSRGGDAR